MHDFVSCDRDFECVSGVVGGEIGGAKVDEPGTWLKVESSFKYTRASKCKHTSLGWVEEHIHVVGCGGRCARRQDRIRVGLVETTDLVAGNGDTPRDNLGRDGVGKVGFCSRHHNVGDVVEFGGRQHIVWSASDQCC